MGWNGFAVPPCEKGENYAVRRKCNATHPKPHLAACRCGRIYCGDKPIPSKFDDKGYWKFGETFFPDTELNNLFDISGLGQSRQNRKDLAVPVKSTEIDKFFE